MAKAIDIGAGMAEDYARIFEDETGEPRTEVVYIMLEDDDDITIRFENKEGKEVSIWFPADRMRRLLLAREIS